MPDYLIGAALGCGIAAAAFVARAYWRSAGICGALAGVLLVLALIARTASRDQQRPS